MSIRRYDIGVAPCRAGWGSGGGGTSAKKPYVYTLQAGDIAAKAITLPSAVTAGQEGNVILLVVGGGMQRPVVDFSVAAAILTWAGLGLDGVLVAGDILGVVYA